MPHLSKKQLNNVISKKLNDQIYLFLAESGGKARKNIYNELLTDTERIMVAKRLAILFLFDRGVSRYYIARILNMSPSTIDRFVLKIEKGVFRETCIWVKSVQGQNRITLVIKKLLLLPFTARSKSFNQILKEL